MRHSRKDILSAFVIFGMCSVLIYVIVRTTLFLFAPYTLIEKSFALFLMVGEFFVLLHSLGYMFSVLRVHKIKKLIKPLAQELGKEAAKPSVAILVAARHEPKEVLEATFITLCNLQYPNKNIYFLDDSSLEQYRKEAEEICDLYKINLFRREVRHGAKAGVINDCLKILQEDYIVVFDSDQNPMPNFLDHLVEMMEEDKGIGFIQTPQFYSNIRESLVARGAAFQQAVFYEYICEGKNTDGAMFCCGTNVMFRREALLDIGGFDESTVTEDFATSIKFHERKWKSVYHNHVGVFGIGPISLSAYFIQQYRWALGTITVLRKVIKKFFRNPLSFHAIQWWEYFLSSTYYFIGIAFFILMMCPVSYILFKIPSFFVKPEIYFLSFLPYIVLSVGIFFRVLMARHYTIKDLFVGQLLGFVTFSVYMRAAFSALWGIKSSFGVTDKTKKRAISALKLWPQITILLLNFIAMVWGINRFIYEREAAIIVNGFWAFYHFILLSSIFYFNEEGVE